MKSKNNFIKIYSSRSETVIDLHRRGFTNDFHLVGKDLLWVQEGVFVTAGEFAILECHKIVLPKNNMKEEIVFGIVIPHHNIKGILLNDYRTYTDSTPPILVKKLNELNIYV